MNDLGSHKFIYMTGTLNVLMLWEEYGCMWTVPQYDLLGWGVGGFKKHLQARKSDSSFIFDIE